MKDKKIGILGNGFVGEAQAFAFSTIADTFVFDTDKMRSKDSLEKVHNADFVFVCVPTPMNRDGSQDISYVEKALDNGNAGPIYILKSTVLPGTTDNLSKKYSDLKIIFSPEFLTERTSKLDMLTQSRIILGGQKELTDKVEKLF